jgi:hypothetical protein
MHFNADIVSDSLYTVRIGANHKLIRKGKYMEYLSWPDYILRYFVTTTEANPLREKPDQTANKIKNLNYTDLNFRCTIISGDWVKVTCNKDCEGCPDGIQISGWIKWRENNKVIIEQYFTC